MIDIDVDEARTEDLDGSDALEWHFAFAGCTTLACLDRNIHKMSLLTRLV